MRPLSPAHTLSESYTQRIMAMSTYDKTVEAVRSSSQKKKWLERNVPDRMKQLIFGDNGCLRKIEENDEHLVSINGAVFRCRQVRRIPEENKHWTLSMAELVLGTAHATAQVTHRP